jgi:hypothetical protein
MVVGCVYSKVTKRKLFSFAVSLVFLSSAVRVPGMEVEDLYTAQVVVSGKEGPERRRGLERGLFKVLRKVSGELQIAENSTIKDALNDPGEYLQQYGYRVQALSAQGAVSPETAEQLILWTQFDPQAIDALLRKAGLPVWGSVRPSVLALIAVEEKGERRVIGADDTSGKIEVLSQAASEWGLPLRFPLLDLQDQMQLSISDIWGGFQENILEAARRYQTEVVLVGRVYPLSDDLWEARWRLFVQDSTRDWVTRGAAPNRLLAGSVREIVTSLAADFASSSEATDSTGIAVVVSGIHTLQDYARTLAYLRKLYLVEDIQVTQAKADEIQFLLATRGGKQALRRVIALDKELVPVETEEGIALQEHLQFRLQQ